GVDSNRVVWVTSARNGLDRIDSDTGKIERWDERLGLEGKALTAVLQDNRAHLWVGTQLGLHRYALDTLSAVEMPVDLTRADALPPGYVDNLVLASDGSIWAGVHGGGAVHIGDEPPRVLKRYIPADRTLGDSDISVLALDASGSPWLATASGVERLDAKRDRFVDVAGVPHESVHALAFAPDGSLWLHRLGALEHYRVSAAGVHLEQRLDAAHGWPTLTARSLAVSADGTVWVTSSRGLWRVDGHSHAIRRFNASDGLPSQEFVAGALTQAPDGVLFAGTLQGAVAFDPATLQLHSSPSPLRITALTMRRRGRVVPLDPAVPVELGYDDLDLSVEARVLSYANPSSNRYQFRLVNFESGWVDANRGERVYSQLPPGDYRLRARGANADGVWTELAQPLHVSVARAPWATPFAYALYAIAMVLA
ncbi:MAG: ligand-binding sensor domain-containing protein, partial [Steroidobacteraceae bacterium]